MGRRFRDRPIRDMQFHADPPGTADLTQRRVNWVLDADIQGFFDAIDHQWLIKFLEHRIGDRRILRLIRKWLHAGVLQTWH